MGVLRCFWACSNHTVVLSKFAKKFTEKKEFTETKAERELREYLACQDVCERVRRANNHFQSLKKQGNGGRPALQREQSSVKWKNADLVQVFEILPPQPAHDTKAEQAEHEAFRARALEEKRQQAEEWFEGKVREKQRRDAEVRKSGAKHARNPEFTPPFAHQVNTTATCLVMAHCSMLVARVRR